MIRLIIDMGFDEASAREALRASKNHQSYACEWLVGNRSKFYQTEQIDGLPLDSPILAALLGSPHVQMSLSSPKMFIGKSAHSIEWNRFVSNLTQFSIIIFPSLFVNS